MPDPASNQATARALVSAGGDLLQELIEKLVASSASPDLHLKIHAPHVLAERAIRALVDTAQFDVCVLILNSIIFEKHVYESADPQEARMQAAVNLVHDLVHGHSVPVVGLYGWSDVPDFSWRVMAAGATAVFPLPFDLEPFQSVVTEILNRRSRNQKACLNCASCAGND